MYIEDLDTNAYFAHGANVRAVGWLESGHPFTRGSVPTDFLSALRSHVKKAHQMVLYMGFYGCSFCPEDRQRAGLRNLLIPTTKLLYAAPELILHYIEDHGYRPPDEFVAAVLSCPEQKSARFFELLQPFEHIWRG
jgi:hypothetical protein